MTRPGTLSFGTFIVVIVSDTPETIRLASEGKVGETNVEGRTISIRSDIDDEQWFEVLLHEAMHVAWHMTALPSILEEHEETVVRSLAPWLAQVVRFMGF